METKRGNYRLVTEPSCMWIEELVEVQDKKTKKTKLDWRRVTGYYNDITLLANNFGNDMILKSDATSMRKFTHELNAKKESIRKMTLKRINEITKG